MDPRDEVLSSVQALIQESGKFSLATYRLWFMDLKIESLTKNEVVLIVNSAYKAEIITDRYLSVLEEYFEEVLGFHIDVYIDIMPSSDISTETINLINSELSDSPAEAEEEAGEEKDPVYLNYTPEYTFDNFIVGNTNKLAQAACKAIAENPDHDYNPLFIYGASGLGKTHLLYAITNQILKNRPKAKIVYARGEEFTTELINALSKKAPMQYFRDRYRTADVLLIDDIQFIAGKPSTQEEFFHTFNTLYNDKKQIILASDLPPKDIKNLEDRLISRFSQGLIVDVQPPDLELRIAILKSKADALGVKLDDMVITYIADNIRNNIRQLEGAIKRLKAMTFLNNMTITMPIAKDALKDFLSESVPVGITIEQIFESVANYYNISVDDMRGKKRLKEITTARHVTIYILRTITELSLNDIGKYFDMHHTSVLSAVNNITENLKNDPKLDWEISAIIREIREGK
jgi:chromosomal replication initiator protein